MKSPARFVTCVALAAIAGASFCAAMTFTVTSASDSGVGTLRRAITAANANPGADVIAFNIPGAGVRTIATASDLPTITDVVTIDGYTQPGAVANTNGPGLGLNSTLRIEVNGNNAGSSCLNVAGDDVTIRGLVMNHCFSNGIRVDSGTNVRIVGNFIGTNPTGDARFADYNYWGVLITSGANDRIGGTAPADRNLIVGTGYGIEVGDGANTGLTIQGNLIGSNAAGNASLVTSDGYGISLRVLDNSTVGGLTASAGNVISGFGGGMLLGDGFNSSGVVDVAIQGNQIGTDAAGTRAIGSTYFGILVYTVDTHFGGAEPGAGNIVAGSLGAGIVIAPSGTGAVIEGNFIGTDRTGTLDLGNHADGVVVQANDCTIGGVAPGAGNVIAYNAGSGFAGGVSVWYAAQPVRIRGNRIFGTRSYAGTGLGIDLVTGSSIAVTPNDDGDGDAGPNGLQNFPIVTAFTLGGGGTTVTMTLNSTPSTTFDVDVYANPPCARRPREALQAETYLGSLPMTTDASGNASVVDAPFSTVLTAGSRITATATDPSGNTSELFPGLAYSVSPSSGPASSGTLITITGMRFQAPATVTVGGLAATNVNVTGADTISAMTPALPPGSANDVTVTSGGLTGTVRNAFVADFLDVPAGSPVDPFVGKLLGNAITAGCGAGNYCPASAVTRAQMAVFLWRAHTGVCDAPPPATGAVFGDVPANSFAAAYIEALASEQVTGGCGNGNYCPTDPVTRAQVAVFLLRTSGGPLYVPPPCITPTFADVPCTSPFAIWVDELARRNITGGCGGGNYCPGSPVTRGQMAVFLVTTFGLP